MPHQTRKLPARLLILCCTAHVNSAETQPLRRTGGGHRLPAGQEF